MRPERDGSGNGKGAMVTSGADEATEAELAALLRALEQGRGRTVGFLGASALDYAPLAPFFDHGLNDFGNPELGSVINHHTRSMEREVVGFFADLFRAPADDRWGYVTSGPDEGTLFGLYAARLRYPDGLVYLSESAHPSVYRALDLLGMRSVTIRSRETGELDYADLRRMVDGRRTHPAIVVATAGTARTGAVDDVRQIRAVLTELAMARSFVHTDAALAGIPHALLDEHPRFDLAEGADSINVSGQEFIGTPFPCGAVVLRRSLRDWITRAEATDTGDTAIGGTRNGHAALLLWYALRRLGRTGLRQRAEQTVALAEYLAHQLTEIGWSAWRNPNAFTVLLKAPPTELANRWRLSIVDGWSRVVCLPGVTRDQLDRFVTDLHETTKPRMAAQRTRLRPRIPATAA
jgi:histidine decarboxylase